MMSHCSTLAMALTSHKESGMAYGILWDLYRSKLTTVWEGLRRLCDEWDSEFVGCGMASEYVGYGMASED